MNRLPLCMLTTMLVVPLEAAAQSAPVSPPALAPAPQACTLTTVALTDTVDSAKARLGDVFHFKTLSNVMVGDQTLPAGSAGAGTVVISNHARGAGRAGNLVLQPRYINAPNGTRVPVSYPAGRLQGVARGGSSNAPLLLAFVPFAGLPTLAYNAFHHGKEAAILAGTRFNIIAGSATPSADCTSAGGVQVGER